METPAFRRIVAENRVERVPVLEVIKRQPRSIILSSFARMVEQAPTPRLRYSGASIGYQLSSVISGGPAPLIATALLAATGSGFAIAFYILFCAVVSIVAVMMMPDYTNKDISEEHDRP